MKPDPGDGPGVPPENVLNHIRIPFVRRATITHRGRSSEVFTIDLGIAGVYVEYPEPLAIGEAVDLRFPWPGNEIPLEARCRVAWRHEARSSLVSKALPAGVGLQFLELSERDRSMIREHMEDHCRRHPRIRRFLRHWPQSERGGDDP